MNIEPGKRFAVLFEITRAVFQGEKWKDETGKEHELSNLRGNLWFARRLNNGIGQDKFTGPEMLCCFDVPLEAQVQKYFVVAVLLE